MFIHDIIKINYINEGYLPNYPYHMISDKEMFEAFIAEGGYLEVNYPLVNSDMQNEYDELITCIKHTVEAFIADETPVPDWIYSYMIGSVISVNSSEQDIHYLYDLTGLECTVLAVFEPEIQEECYRISEEWLKKLPVSQRTRPPALFGEPHVIKSLRLNGMQTI